MFNHLFLLLIVVIIACRTKADIAEQNNQVMSSLRGSNIAPITSPASNIIGIPETCEQLPPEDNPDLIDPKTVCDCFKIDETCYLLIKKNQQDYNSALEYKPLPDNGEIVSCLCKLENTPPGVDNESGDTVGDQLPNDSNTINKNLNIIIVLQLTFIVLAVCLGIYIWVKTIPVTQNIGK